MHMSLFQKIFFREIFSGRADGGQMAGNLSGKYMANRLFCPRAGLFSGKASFKKFFIEKF